MLAPAKECVSSTSFDGIPRAGRSSLLEEGVAVERRKRTVFPLRSSKRKFSGGEDGQVGEKEEVDACRKQQEQNSTARVREKETLHRQDMRAEQCVFAAQLEGASTKVRKQPFKK